MIEFASDPDPAFLAIVIEALDYVREELYPFVDAYEPTEEDLADLDETYCDLHPILAPLFTRTDVLSVVDKVRSALKAQDLYRPTDFHWLVLYDSLAIFCDLHNDDALGTDGKVAQYIIDRIDFGYVVDRFFHDTDFLFGPELLVAREHKLEPVPGVTPQAAKIAAGIRPDAEDLELERIDPAESLADDGQISIPASGYIGPYPLREASVSDGI